MKRLLLLSIMGVIGLSMVAQNVTNVSFQIIGNRAVINYSLDKQADIYLYVSTNESEGWNTSFMNWGAYQKTAPALRAVKGDVGRRVTPGQSKQMVWSFTEEVAPFFEKSENGITASFVLTNGGKFSSEVLNSLQFKVEACPSTEEPDLVWIDGCDGCGNYWIGRYLITVAEFASFVKETGYITQAEKQGFGEIWDKEKNDWKKEKGVSWRCDENGHQRNIEDYDRFPVVNVSWEDANAYCVWLGKKYNKQYYLPDERDWCEVCAGLVPGGLYLGGQWEDLSKDWAVARMGGNPNEIGWFNFNSSYQIHPIGKKRANAFHIYDMRGNVYEWNCNPVDIESTNGPSIVYRASDYDRLQKSNKLTHYSGCGGSAFEPYDSMENMSRHWPKEATGVNIGFRVCMYPNKDVSWKNYIPTR